MFNPLKKSSKYEIVETSDFSCPGMTGFIFKYPVFKGLEVKKIEMSDKSACQVFLNEPVINANEDLSLGIIIPPPHTPAPRFQVTKNIADGLPSVDAKNTQGVFYKLVRSTGDPLHEYILFLGKDFVININLFGIDEKFSFSKDIFWKSVIESFNFTNQSLFEGILEEGQVYEATWPIENEVRHNLPYHHAFNIKWKNITDFPQLKNSDKFVFKVISKKTYKVSTQYRWNDEYVCEIVNLLPL